MHPQLEVVADEYRSAQRRLHDLAGAVALERWGRRSDPARWCVAECVAHLNLTSLAYLPLLRDAVARAGTLEMRPAGRYHRDVVGWLLWRTMGPPVRVRLKTLARFVPSSAGNSTASPRPTACRSRTSASLHRSTHACDTICTRASRSCRGTNTGICGRPSVCGGAPAGADAGGTYGAGPHAGDPSPNNAPNAAPSAAPTNVVADTTAASEGPPPHGPTPVHSDWLPAMASPSANPSPPPMPAPIKAPRP